MRFEPQPAAFVTTRSTPLALEDVDQAPRPREPFVEPPGVDRERAAARLPARRDDLEPVRGEHSRGRDVDVAEDDALDAAREEADPADAARHAAA